MFLDAVEDFPDVLVFGIESEIQVADQKFELASVKEPSFGSLLNCFLMDILDILRPVGLFSLSSGQVTVYDSDPGRVNL